MPPREQVLITGGAGFVGSHLADALAAAGHEVVLFDNLEPQVHGDVARPAYLDPAHRLVRGDLRDPEALAPLLRTADVVFHLGAVVGVGQSMYEITRYTEVNAMGTANLLQRLVAEANRPRLRKLVVASSMSIYGEGAYVCPSCGRVAPKLRPAAQLARQEWEVHCPRCRAILSPVATDEEKPLAPSSIYAINKRDQEEMVLSFGQAYGLPAVALRFFNIYGSRQALSNPYTGVAAIFSGRMLSGQKPLVFEDGHQQRDFVHVSDVVQACVLAMERAEADHDAFNVGTGRPISVLEVGQAVAEHLGWNEGFEVVGKYRAGDIRHCFADISKARTRLGYQPKIRFEDGVAELVRWVTRQQGVQHDAAAATTRLAALGLVR